METLCLPATFPGPYRCIHIAQFENVKNGEALREALISASKTPEHSEARQKMDYAFLDARCLVSKHQIHTACVEAIVASLRINARDGGVMGLKTPSIHSEILWTLNPNNNIADALRRFGVSGATKTLLLVHVCASAPEGKELQTIVRAMEALVDGDLRTQGISLALDPHSASTLLPPPEPNWKEIKMMYKLQDSPAHS
ncbi:hypothetical protein MVES1_000431 [Malassezia vespertilionis]|uniref:EKC/KEOPS complex subunit CGI121 n=1 Tax=Malassezia vespertilionis TaxID=2020962 RepID=A0A2N1JHD2_9BASI|nr:uncharacterized protein MVES1_000431 [Malassezia vespertilionis]PKI85952.1 Cgi121p [Malassezia vespertilionis]WFD05105.1 hypothetical protein MVES1_000431 [Malassezia vespertilionis]